MLVVAVAGEGGVERGGCWRALTWRAGKKKKRKSRRSLALEGGNYVRITARNKGEPWSQDAGTCLHRRGLIHAREPGLITILLRTVPDWLASPSLPYVCVCVCNEHRMCSEGVAVGLRASVCLRVCVKVCVCQDCFVHLLWL